MLLDKYQTLHIQEVTAEKSSLSSSCQPGPSKRARVSDIFGDLKKGILQLTPDEMVGSMW